MRFQVQLLVAALLLGAASALNVTDVLLPFPNFSLFSQLLTTTGVADEINQQNSVSLFVVDNGVVGGLSGAGFSDSEVTDILRYHTGLQAFSYDDIRNLPNKTALVATLYQGTGRALFQNGYLNVTDESDGSVGLGVPGGSRPNATIVTNITQQSYIISVFQASNALLPIGLQQAALTNITAALVTGGQYNTLITLLKQTGLDVVVQQLAANGVVLFAPTDSAFNKVQSTLATLSADQVSLVLKFHVLAKYVSQAQLEQEDGVETTASGDNVFISSVAGQVVVQSGYNNATVQTTVVDKSPAAIYAIDAVLIPPVIFAPAPAPGPLAPGPAVEGPAPAVEGPAPAVEGPAPAVEGPAPASPIPAPGTAPVPSPASTVPSPASPIPAPGTTPVPSVAPTTPVPTPTTPPTKAPTPSTPPTTPSKAPTPSTKAPPTTAPVVSPPNAAAGLVVSVVGVMSAALVASGLLLL